MGQSCHLCGSAIDSSSPFCTHCGAPQIHFLGRHATGAPISVAAPPPLPPPTVLFEPRHDFEQTAPGPNQSALLRSALHAGVIAAILTFIPVRSAFLLALPLAGSLSVLLDRRRVPGEEISSGAGFRLGALSGLFGFAIVVVLTAATIFISHGESDVRDAMLQTIRQAQARNPDLQARQVLDFFTTPQGLIVVMVLSFFFAGIMFVLLSGLGGSISATLQRRRRPRA